MTACVHAVLEPTGAFCKVRQRHESHGVCRACGGSPAPSHLSAEPTSPAPPDLRSPQVWQTLKDRIYAADDVALLDAMLLHVKMYEPGPGHWTPCQVQAARRKLYMVCIERGLK